MNITNQPRYIAGVRHDYCPGCQGYIHPLNECECDPELWLSGDGGCDPDVDGLIAEIKEGFDGYKKEQE